MVAGEERVHSGGFYWDHKWVEVVAEVVGAAFLVEAIGGAEVAAAVSGALVEEDLEAAVPAEIGNCLI